ncbi:hypothetical protein F4782DRAFT_544350 [Xylaria castorea]|nr:hypothetical protein F4782DRAFT_544350 [Xylaria castorea]
MPRPEDPIQIPVETLAGEERLLSTDIDFNAGPRGVDDKKRPLISYGFETGRLASTYDNSDGGFSVLEDHELIEVKAPSGSEELYFNYGQHPRNPSGTMKAKTPWVQSVVHDGKTEKRTDLLQGYESSGVTAGNQDPKPSYSAFVYQRVGLPEESPYASEKFVFTGNADTRNGSYVAKNIFVPLEALRIRLNGTRKERLIAYTQDWITFCNYALDKKKPEQGFINFRAPTSGFYNVNNHENTDYRLGFNGSHLKARDTTGAYTPEETRKFLSTLLEPHALDRCDNLPIFIFRRWCAVAYGAAVLPKEPYSVSARFWNCPETLGPQITFIYDKPKGIIDCIKNIMTETRTTEFDEIKFPALNPEEIWKAAVTAAHNQTKKNAGMTLAKSVTEGQVNGEPPSPRSEFRDPKIGKEEWEAKHTRLGSHPQHFFTIWIKKEHERLLEANHFTFNDFREFPRSIIQDSIDKYDKKKVPTEGRPASTITCITQRRIESAGNFPRCKTQAAVMGGVSATEVAKKLWPNIKYTRVAEWLHRSAYSYGGLGIDKVRPDSSQTVENLVFGTFEANTSMIRYEEYLKRMARRLEQYGKKFNPKIEQEFLAIKLQTTPDPLEVAWDGKCPSWLVPNLDYRWEIPVGIKGARVAQTHRFSPFSRSYPMRFEVEMDKCFEHYFFGDKGQDEKLRQFLWLWMLAQAYGVSNELN